MSVEITKKIVAQMKAQGNQPGLIAIYKREMGEWAKRNPKSVDAQAVMSWLPNFKERPFYTAIELVPLFPVLGLALGFTSKLQGQKSSKRLATELEFCMLPKVMNVYGDCQFWHPVYQQTRYPHKAEFFIVEHLHKRKNLRLTQDAFNEEFL